MAKLTFKDEFSIEHEDEVLTGTFAQLTRKQTKAFSKKYDDKDPAEHDTAFKERLNISITGDDKEKIMALGEEYEYKTVFETIIRDIAEKREKNS